VGDRVGKWVSSVNLTMQTNHSLADLKHYHNEAMQFFASELMMLKEVIPRLVDDRLAKTATLLISCGQTGAALLQLSAQTDTFTGESLMLARSFMEKITNFCYVNICDEREYRAFLLHPIYKHYHNTGSPTMEEDIDFSAENAVARQKKQEELRKIPIVQEALALFSETNSRMNWTRKAMGEKIDIIAKWGKLLDVFFTLNKLEYYSDASEALHGSLYGCTFNVGVFERGFDHTKGEEIEKKLYKDNACVLLHLGMLVHESFTLISYTEDIKEFWDASYRNRGAAVNLLYHILGKSR
jgi:Family of unknown function (DUF5677)